MSKVMYTDYQISGNLRRATKKGLLAALSKKQLIELTDKYFRDENGVLHCAYSWEPIVNQDDLELEHVIPISRGGGTVLFNVVPSISSINGMGEEKKANKNLLDWWEERVFYKTELLENLVKYILESYEISMKHEASEQEYIYEQDNPISKKSVNVELAKIENRKYNREKISYFQFLTSCLIKLRENGININSYLDRLNNLQENKLFEFYEKQRTIQTELFNLFKIYCPEYKYDITTSINYFPILEKYKNNTISDIIKEISKRINEVNKYCFEHNLNANEILHTIIYYQEILWEDNYTIKKLEEISMKRLNDLCDEIEKFCIKNGWFPRAQIYLGNSQMKERSDLSDEELYEVRLCGKYKNNKKQLSQNQKSKIQQLKKQYSKQKIIDTSELYEEIIDFTIKKWFPRGSLRMQRKELTAQEQEESLLYINYRNHISKFTKEQFDQLETLKENKSYLRVSFDQQYMKIVEFVEHNGYFPRTKVKGEGDLYHSYYRNRENFTKEQLDNLDELRQQKSFFDYNAVAIIEELKEFIRINKRFPQSEIRENGIRLNASQFTKEQQYEVNLYAKFRRTKNRIPKKIMEELEHLRERLYYDELYESILAFIDTNGHFPISINKKENGKILKAEELSPEKLYEKRLYSNFAQAKRKNKFRFEQIANLLELQKSKQIYFCRANQIYNQLIDFINTYHRFPKGSIWKNNQQLTRAQMTDEEIYEVNLYLGYYRLKEYLTEEQQIFIDSNKIHDENKRRAS